MRVILGALLTAILSTSLPSLAGGKQMIYYVAPTGTDQSDGSKEHPFATLERARDAVRALRRKGLPTGGVTVWLRAGTYARHGVFELTAEDSGTSEAPIVYATYQSETVCISGGTAVTGFASVTDPAVLTGSIRLPEGRCCR
jgi:hypothetical protein